MIFEGWTLVHPFFMVVELVETTKRYVKLL